MLMTFLIILLALVILDATPYGYSGVGHGPRGAVGLVLVVLLVLLLAGRL